MKIASMIEHTIERTLDVWREEWPVSFTKIILGFVTYTIGENGCYCED
ncbi:MAG: hypothetical protein KGQ83_09600 [Planctomycetes bacterium]|nr:hypothetical protein [Planctomycetota bacterium]